MRRPAFFVRICSHRPEVTRNTVCDHDCRKFVPAHRKPLFSTKACLKIKHGPNTKFDSSLVNLQLPSTSATSARRRRPRDTAYGSSQHQYHCLLLAPKPASFASSTASSQVVVNLQATMHNKSCVLNSLWHRNNLAAHIFSEP